MKNFLDLLISGGVLMIPIILCSVIALGIFLERLFYLRKKKLVPPDLDAAVRELVRREKISEALAILENDKSPLARILGVALANFRRRRDVIKEAIEEVGGQEAEYLEKYLRVLSVIAQISPLLGLLGTVQGIIQVFNQIVTYGVGDPARFADGIAVALITTAAGLTVAIPTLVAYNYLRGRVQEIVLELQERSLQFLELVKAEE